MKRRAFIHVGKPQVWWMCSWRLSLSLNQWTTYSCPMWRLIAESFDPTLNEDWQLLGEIAEALDIPRHELTSAAKTPPPEVRYRFTWPHQGPMSLPQA